MIDPYFVRWVISNVIVLVLLFLCWKHPKYGRIGFAVIFLSAGIVNTLTALFGPHGYLEFKHFVIFDFYREFIEGFFARHIQPVVLTIALGQFLISAGLFYGKRLLRPALIGGIIFSLAITPLGLGSAMPVPLIMILSLWILYSKQFTSQKNVIT